MLQRTRDRAIKIATNLVESNTPAVELVEQLMRCQHESYRGLNIFVEDLDVFSTYFVIDGAYKKLMTKNSAESAEIAWQEAKQWVHLFHASEDEDDRSCLTSLVQRV
jgi:hypothetical protein